MKGKCWSDQDRRFFPYRFITYDVEFFVAKKLFVLKQQLFLSLNTTEYKQVCGLCQMMKKYNAVSKPLLSVTDNPTISSSLQRFSNFLTATIVE